MWLNYALECAILANILAQVIKVPLHLLMKRQWQPMLIFSTGGMCCFFRIKLIKQS